MICSSCRSSSSSARAVHRGSWSVSPVAFRVPPLYRQCEAGPQVRGACSAAPDGYHARHGHRTRNACPIRCRPSRWRSVADGWPRPGAARAAAQSQCHGAGDRGRRRAPVRAGGAVQGDRAAMPGYIMFFTNYLSRKGARARRQPARRGGDALGSRCTGRCASRARCDGPGRRQRRLLRHARLAEPDRRLGQPPERTGRLARRPAGERGRARRAASARPRRAPPAPSDPDVDIPRPPHWGGIGSGRKRWSCGSRARRACTTARAGRARSRPPPDGLHGRCLERDAPAALTPTRTRHPKKHRHRVEDRTHRRSCS